MSLEARIEALTEALHANTSALLNLPQKAVKYETESQDPSPAVVPGPAPKAKEPAAKPASKTKENPATNKTTFEDVTKATLALADKNKNKALEVLQSFNVNKASELTEDQYGAVHSKLVAALAVINEAEAAGAEESLV